MAASALFEYRRINQARKDHRQKALDIMLKSFAARITDLRLHYMSLKAPAVTQGGPFY